MLQFTVPAGATYQSVSKEVGVPEYVLRAINQGAGNILTSGQVLNLPVEDKLNARFKYVDTAVQQYDKQRMADAGYASLGSSFAKQYIENLRPPENVNTQDFEAVEEILSTGEGVDFQANLMSGNQVESPPKPAPTDGTQQTEVAVDQRDTQEVGDNAWLDQEIAALEANLAEQEQADKDELENLEVNQGMYQPEEGEASMWANVDQQLADREAYTERLEAINAQAKVDEPLWNDALGIATPPETEKDVEEGAVKDIQEHTQGSLDLEQAKPSWLEHLRDREGVRNEVYLDSLGKPTVGVGHLLTGKEGLKVGDTISDEEVSKYLEEDSKKAWDSAVKQAKEIGRTDPEFVKGLASVNFQLGIGWNEVHKNTWKLLKENNWEAAAKEAADSKWNTQTPVRVKDFQQAILRG
jgi:lysozyme